MSLEDADTTSVALYSVFSGLVLVTNIIVIIVIVKSKELHHPTLWNIAVMATWDLAYGLYIIVFVVPSKILNEFAYPDSYGRVSSILMSFIITQNVFNIMLALVDRYISVCHPLHYPRLMTLKRFTVAFTVLFLVNLTRTIIFLATDGAGSYNKSLGFYTQNNPTTFRSYSRILTFLVAFVIIGLLIRIRLELGKRKRNENASSQAMPTQFTNTMLVSTIVYGVCYIPLAIALLVNNLLKEESVVVMQIGYTVVISNSVWNVFIYAVTYRPFRDAFLKLFCPSYFRERARREIQVQFRDNRVTIFTVE